MHLYLENERRARQDELSLPPDAIPLEPLDSIARTSQRHGYSAKVFEVKSIADPLITGIPRLTLLETDPNDEVWLSDYELPVDTAPVTVTVVASQGFASFNMEPWAIRNANSNDVRPALRLTWNGDQPDARGLRWEVRVTGGTTVAMGSLQGIADGELIVSEGILPATSFQGRVKLIADRPTTWSGWIESLAPDLRFGVDDLDPDFVEIVVDTQAAVVDAQEAADDARARVGVVADDLRSNLPAVRTTEQAVADIEAYLLVNQLQLAELDRRVVDAGIYVDQETGRVEITGVQSAQDQAAQVALTIDALNASISQRVTFSDLTEFVFGDTLVPEFSEFSGRLSTVETTLSGIDGTITNLSETLTVDGGLVTMATVSGTLDSLGAALTTKVDVVTFDALNLSERLTNVETATSVLDGAVVTRTLQDQRTLADALADQEAATLVGLIDGFLADEGLRRGNASVAEQLTAIVTDGLEAEATARRALTAEVGQTTARQITEQRARSDGDAALAGELSALSASLEATDDALAEVSAEVVQDRQASVGRDGALARDLTVLTAGVASTNQSVASVAAQVTADRRARVTGDEALAAALTALTGTVGDATSSIRDLSQTRVTAAQAVAAVTQEISARYASLTAMATAAAFAQAGVNGLLSGYRWRAVADGVAGEVELISNGARSQFQVRADNIKFIGDLTELISDVQIDGDLIVDGATLRSALIEQSGSTTVGNPTQIGANAAVDFEPFRVQGGIVQNPVIVEITGYARNLDTAQNVVLQFDVLGRVGSGPWAMLSDGLRHYDASGQPESRNFALKLLGRESSIATQAGQPEPLNLSTVTEIQLFARRAPGSGGSNSISVTGVIAEFRQGNR